MAEPTTTAERLAQVQAQLKVPKAHRNQFGNYDYRNCEDILEAVKPLLHKQGLVLTISDELVMLGDRFYVRAEARLIDPSNPGGGLEAWGYAREEETKKGMDASQITGSASSYARKYALNGLFCIDDTKDADSEAPQEPKRGKPAVDLRQGRADLAATAPRVVKPAPITEAQMRALHAAATARGYDHDMVSLLVRKRYGHTSTKQLSYAEAEKVIKFWNSASDEEIELRIATPTTDEETANTA